MRTLTVLLLVLTAAATAQNYRCDWSVVALGGGDMVGTGYRCGATAGQTAAGYMNGPLYQAFIGFWQTDVQTGIAEEQVWSNAGPLVTRLCSPSPNPSRGQTGIRYSLAAQGPVCLQMHDLTGRVVKTLVNSSQPAGRYSLRWDGRDDSGRRLAAGVYFVRMAATDDTQAVKLLMAR